MSPELHQASPSAGAAASSSAVGKERWGNTWEGHLDLSDQLEQERPRKVSAHRSQGHARGHRSVTSTSQETGEPNRKGCTKKCHLRPWAQAPKSQFSFHTRSPTLTRHQRRRRLWPALHMQHLEWHVRSHLSSRGGDQGMGGSEHLIQPGHLFLHLLATSARGRGAGELLGEPCTAGQREDISAALILPSAQLLVEKEAGDVLPVPCATESTW